MKKQFLVIGCLLVGIVLSAPALTLVENGQAAATIVLPDQTNQWELAAAQLLERYLGNATGVRFRKVSEPAKAEGNIISVGHTKLAEAAGLTEEGLEHDGYRILVRGRVLYILGRDRPTETRRGWVGCRGTYRAAFGLLNHLGFRWVVPGAAGTVVPAFENQTVEIAGDLDVTRNPPLMYAMSRFDRFGDWSWANAFRTPIEFYTEGGHTWETFVPAALWDEHPDYFAMDAKGQRMKPTGKNHYLCPTHPAVIQLLADGLRKKFDEGYDLVQLGQSDGFTPCHCPRCSALGEGYETEQVHVAHAKAMEEVYKTHPNKQVLMILYGPTKTPSRLVQQYPPNTVFEITSPNEETIKKWAPKAAGGATVYVYYFGVWQRRGLLPKQSPWLMAEEMKKLHALGIRGMYWCGGGENWGLEGPAYYTVARLTDDITLGWQAILNEYCAALFGKAAPIMEKYYKLMGSRVGAEDRGLLHNEALTKSFPPDVLEKADALLAQAKQLAAGNERAQNWLRLVDYAHRHARLAANVCHLYNAYQVNRTRENLVEIQAAAAAYRKLAEEIQGLQESDPSFVRDYFPNYRYWKDGTLTNVNQARSPFRWDFEAILAANMLPGRDRRQGVIRRLAKAPAIDGRADDPAWQAIEPQTLYEVAMGTVQAQTEFRMGYDDENLYVVFVCEEPLFDEMHINDYERDGAVFRTECVELFFDPYAEGTKMMHFIATPHPTGIYDARRGYIDDPLHPLVLNNREDRSWDPEWRRAFAMDKEGKRWTVEVAIPFQTLGVPTPEDGDRWRVNFARERNLASWEVKKYKDAPVQFYLWSPNLQKASFLDQSVFGDLYFGHAP